MHYGELLGMSCIYLLNEKQELLQRIYEGNYALAKLYKYDIDLCNENTQLYIENNINELNNILTELKDKVIEIDNKFSLIIKGLLQAFSKTNILEKDLTDKLIYGTI